MNEPVAARANNQRPGQRRLHWRSESAPATARKKAYRRAPKKLSRHQRLRQRTRQPWLQPTSRRTSERTTLPLRAPATSGTSGCQQRLESGHTYRRAGEPPADAQENAPVMESAHQPVVAPATELANEPANEPALAPTGGLPRERASHAPAGARESSPVMARKRGIPEGTHEVVETPADASENASAMVAANEPANKRADDFASAGTSGRQLRHERGQTGGHARSYRDTSGCARERGRRGTSERVSVNAPVAARANNRRTSQRTLQLALKNAKESIPESTQEVVETPADVKERASRGCSERAGEQASGRLYQCWHQRAPATSRKRACWRGREELPRHQRMRKRARQPWHRPTSPRAVQPTSQRASRPSHERGHESAGQRW